MVRSSWRAARLYMSDVQSCGLSLKKSQLVFRRPASATPPQLSAMTDRE
jgi:hypothetical protein